jgi:glycosyltransferase involved in cell wall biosynthesis
VASLSAGGWWADRIRELDVPVTELPRRHGFELARLRALHRLVRRDGPHVLQTFSPYDIAYGFPVGRLNRVPVLVASRRTDAELYSGLGWAAGRVSRALSRWADAIICNSEQPRDRAPSALRARHVVIHNGVEPLRPSRPRTDVRRALGLPEAAPVVGSVGRLVPAKDHAVMLQVAVDVLRTHPETTFLLVGGGPLERELRTRVRRLALERRVWLMGEREDDADLMSALDIFLLTSNREGMPNAVMEAMTLGLPCVVSNTGASAELVVAGETGYVCPVGDRDALATSVRRLLEDEECRKRFGANGKARMAREFAPDRMADATGALYSRLLAKGARSPSATAEAVSGSVSR